MHGVSSEEEQLISSFLAETNNTQNLVGRINSTCNPPGDRPIGYTWDRFTEVSVINMQNDWTIFAKAFYQGRDWNAPLVIDLMESQNLFRVRIGSFYPWEAKLDDANAISYRISNTKIIIRCLKIYMSQASYCYLDGMIAAESSKLVCPDTELFK
jgi:hypothetical protein